MLSSTPYRLSKSYFALAVILIFLIVLFAPFTSHGQGTRQALVGIVEKVKVKTGNTLQGVGGEGRVRWSDEEEAMREWELRRALQHEGSSARMQAFLDKARSGQPFTVSVIGGSVSKGRGLIPPTETGWKERQETARLDVSEEGVGSEQVNVDITEVPPSTPSAQIGASTLYSPENLHMIIFDYLNETFPHPQNRFVNGAQGGVGAGYFGWCFNEHIPEDSDLVLVELGINDLLEMESISTYEHLLRGVLELDKRPAVINIETFTTLFPSLISSSTFHLDILQFYDVPSIAIRDVLLPRILADPERQMPRWFRTGADVKLGDPKVREFRGIPVDVMHISGLGHALAAGLVIRYLEEQIARNTPSTSSGLGRFSSFASSTQRKPTLRIMDIPAVSLTGDWNPYEAHVKHMPVCRSENSAKNHGLVSTNVDDFSDGQYTGLNPGADSHGWSRWAWEEKRYLIAKDPGSTVLFDFVVSPPVKVEPSADDEAAQIVAELVQPGGKSSSHQEEGEEQSKEVRTNEGRRWLHSPNRRQSSHSGGSILIGYQRSAKLGLGSVWCWVDDDREGGTQVDGWWKLDKRNMGMVKEIAHDLSPGPHKLHCELLRDTLDPDGGTEFRLFAVMHD